MKSKKNTVAACPSCGGRTLVGDHPKISQFVNCRFCGEELEIIKLNPIILDWLYVQNDDIHSKEYEYELSLADKWEY